VLVAGVSAAGNTTGLLDVVGAVGATLLSVGAGVAGLTVSSGLAGVAGAGVVTSTFTAAGAGIVIGVVVTGCVVLGSVFAVE
jgi:hypothetical protein